MQHLLLPLTLSLTRPRPFFFPKATWLQHQAVLISKIYNSFYFTLSSFIRNLCLDRLFEDSLVILEGPCIYASPSTKIHPTRCVRVGWISLQFIYMHVCRWCGWWFYVHVHKYVCPCVCVFTSSPHWHMMWQKVEFTVENPSSYTGAKDKNSSSPSTFGWVALGGENRFPSLVQCRVRASGSFFLGPGTLQCSFFLRWRSENREKRCNWEKINPTRHVPDMSMSMRE